MSSGFFSTSKLTVLSHWLEDAADARLDSLGVSGGFSGAVIWRVAFNQRGFCLRRWPQVHPTADGLLAIHGLLRYLGAAGSKDVPVPLLTRSGSSFVVSEDHLWELTPWMPGEASFSRDPTPEKLAAAMRALARLHLHAEQYGCHDHGERFALSPGLQERTGRLRHIRAGGLDELWRAVRAAQPSDLREIACEMLEGISHAADQVWQRLQQVAEAPLPMQWCLRDVRHDHILFTGDAVTGVVDFGAAAVDSVAGDLARLLGSMVNDDPEGWVQGVDAYESCRPLSKR